MVIRIKNLSVIATSIFSLSVAVAYGSTLDDVLNDWRKYDADVRTVVLDCLYERTEEAVRRADGTTTNDPFAPLDALDTKEPITLFRTVKITVSGTKIACVSKGDFWNRNSSSITDKARSVAFDGNQSVSLYNDSRLPVVMIEAGKEPTDSLSNSAEMNPIHFAFTPLSLLKHKTYDLSQAKVKDAIVDYNGVDVVELSIPTANKLVTASVLVEASFGHRILYFEHAYGGATRRSIEFQYVDNDTVGWVLSGWHSKYLQATGNVKLSITGSVIEARINEAVDDSAFAVDIPVGAHISGPRGLFEKQADGQLKPISRKEFGQPKDNDDTQTQLNRSNPTL